MNKQWKMSLAMVALAATCMVPAVYATAKTAPANAVAPVAAMVNINTATVEQLSAIKGLGLKKAQAIIDYRQENGPFKSVDDLSQVSGIGDKLLVSIKPYVTVNA